MNQLDKIRPELIEMFEKHSNFYNSYIEKNKLHIVFSDMVLGITPVGWDIYFMEIMHRLEPGKNQLAYAKVCKNKEQLIKTMVQARNTYEKPETSEPQERIGFTVDVKQILTDKLKDYPTFVKIYTGYEKLFIVFDDLLVLVEPMGGSFYNWELFKREGELEVEHFSSGAMVGFDSLVETIIEKIDEFHSQMRQTSS
jgi:hypothetical protein